MARADLIDEYSSRLRRLLRWRPDADDVLAETEDHLRTTAEHLMLTGAGPVEAQRLTLQRFGAPELVARSFATTPTGGLNMPTRFTRMAGHVAIIAASAWVLAGVTGVFAQTELVVAWSQMRYTGWSALVGLAAATAGVALIGLIVRAGAVRDVRSIAAVVLIGASIALFVTFTWLWLFGGAALAVAAAIVLVLARSAGLPVHRSAWLLVAAFPAGFAGFGVADVLKLGPIDQYGEYPVAAVIGIGLSAALVAIPLVVLGNWLRGEEPVEIPPSVATV